MTKQAKYLTEVRYRLNRVWSHLSMLPPRQVTRAHIEPVLVRLAKTKMPETVNGYRRDMAAICNYGVNLGVLPFSPVRGIPRVPDHGNKRKPVPTAALKSLILAADPDLRARLLFCAYTGCRWIEMARLTWPEVLLGDLPVALLTTRKRRGGHVGKRSQPLTPAAVEAIESMRGKHHLYVFPRAYNRGQAIYGTDKLHLDQLCTRVGVGRWSWHQIRHWVGMTAARAGKNRRAIADLLGQQSVSATDRYIHAASEEVWQMAGGLVDALNLEPRAPTGKGVREDGCASENLGSK